MATLPPNTVGMRQFQTNGSATPPQDGLLTQIKGMTPDQALYTYTKSSEMLEGAYRSIGRLIQAGKAVSEQQPRLSAKIQQLEQQAGRLEQIQGLIVQAHPQAFMQPQVWQS
jgi:hypothetical protein